MTRPEECQGSQSLSRAFIQMPRCGKEFEMPAFLHLNAKDNRENTQFQIKINDY